MTPEIKSYLAVQSILAGVGAVFILFLRYRYRATISRVARRQEYQYAMFALRDDTIRLIAEGKASESDPNWRLLYRFVNDAAKTMTMNSVMSAWIAPLFLISLVRKLPSAPSDIHKLKAASVPIRRILGETCTTLLAIMLDGNRPFKFFVTAVMRVSAAKKFAVKMIPELARIGDWRAILQSVGGTATIPRLSHMPKLAQ